MRTVLIIGLILHNYVYASEKQAGCLDSIATAASCLIWGASYLSSDTASTKESNKKSSSPDTYDSGFEQTNIICNPNCYAAIRCTLLCPFRAATCPVTCTILSGCWLCDAAFYHYDRETEAKNLTPWFKTLCCVQDKEN